MSERAERLTNGSHLVNDASEDQDFCKRIWTLLGSRLDTSPRNCDAVYYDYSVLPERIKDKFCRDAYLLYCVTDEGKFICRWVERYHLDNEK